MVFDNRDDKIKFIRDDLNKESLDDIVCLLKRIPVDMYREQFFGYDHCSRKNVHDIVSGI